MVVQILWVSSAFNAKMKYKMNPEFNRYHPWLVAQTCTIHRLRMLTKEYVSGNPVYLILHKRTNKIILCSIYLNAIFCDVVNFYWTRMTIKLWRALMESLIKSPQVHKIKYLTLYVAIFRFTNLIFYNPIVIPI